MKWSCFCRALNSIPLPTSCCAARCGSTEVGLKLSTELLSVVSLSALLMRRGLSAHSGCICNSSCSGLSKRTLRLGRSWPVVCCLSCATNRSERFHRDDSVRGTAAAWRAAARDALQGYAQGVRPQGISGSIHVRWIRLTAKMRGQHIHLEGAGCIVCHKTCSMTSKGQEAT